MSQRNQRTPYRAHELPHDIYPVDPWALIEHGFHPESLPLLETVMALGNGMLGVRGGFHTGRPSYQPGVLLNGFYEAWPIEYPEPAFGYATTGQTILYVPDPTVIRLGIDGEPIDFENADLTHWWRRLHFRRGLLSHRYRLTTAAGTDVVIRVTRMVSVARQDLIGTRMAILATRDADIQFDSYLLNRQDTDYLEPGAEELDPRRAKNFGRRVLDMTHLEIDGLRMVAAYQTVQSQLSLGIGVNHVLRAEHETEEVPDRDRPHLRIHSRLTAGQRLVLEKLSVYRTGSLAHERAADAIDGASHTGFVRLLDAHAGAWRQFWRVADIAIEDDPETQQALRWVLFQLHQASAQMQGVGIPAKGVTGQAYDGHTFWDTEIFVLPFLAYTRPSAAASLLRHRYSMLDQARRRAVELSVEGALFPWRTISGEEASAYYAAGTAQYHINAAIAYAIRKYVEITGDEELLWNFGVEMLVETARMWASLGFYRDDEFHISGVTGPDEYTTVVDDNAYTNLMAQMNLTYAAEAVEWMRAERPQRWSDLAQRIGVNDDEIDRWLQCAGDMYVPFDKELGITMQDASFLERERWPFEEVPPEKYPLLLHYHPLVIYRYQVLKQADVVMAMLLLPDKFSPELKRANFDYYDPLTTGDSSLSACVQSIVAAEIGYEDRALQYFKHALWTDLGDLQGNTTDGVHLASAGGVWMAIVYGFGGMRDTDGKLSFDPRLPKDWAALTFKLRKEGCTIRVHLRHEDITLVCDDGPINVSVRAEELTLADEPVTVAL